MSTTEIKSLQEQVREQVILDAGHSADCIWLWRDCDPGFVKREVKLRLELAGYAAIRPISDWHEDYGCALWHHLPICEPPYVGTPLDIEFDSDYYTHWQKMVQPESDGSALIPQPVG